MLGRGLEEDAKTLYAGTLFYPETRVVTITGYDVDRLFASASESIRSLQSDTLSTFRPKSSGFKRRFANIVGFSKGIASFFSGA